MALLGLLLLVTLASSCLENAFGSYPLDASSAWQPFWDQDDVQDMIDDVPENPNIWTDGSREPIPHLDIDIAGAGAFYSFSCICL